MQNISKPLEMFLPESTQAKAVEWLGLDWEAGTVDFSPWAPSALPGGLATWGDKGCSVPYQWGADSYGRSESSSSYSMLLPAAQGGAAGDC